VLPNKNISFPPKEIIQEYSEIYEADAWFSGSAERLANFYAGSVYPTGSLANDFFSDIYNQTVAPKRKFWAKELYDERRVMVHVPIAGDIARTSADLLFSESPKFTVQNEQTQKRLEEIILSSNIQNKLIEGAETASAIGGIYYKINWSADDFNYPILSIAQPDSAIPVFKWGKLVECTFWKEIKKEELKNTSIVYRLLEHHSKGKIEYGLYKGDEDFLGMRIGLQAIEETSGLLDEINTGIDDILCRYIPNVLPNKKYRGSNFGQSDFASLYGLMDALDETYSSWMRDIRLAKSRIIVPESFLQKTENGDFVFDVDREVFTPLDIDPITSKDVGVTMSQFEIRAEQYEKTILELLHRIISSSGYSPQSFGLSIDGNTSGVALSLRERQSYITKEKKTRYWKPALIDLIYLMLQVDSIHLNSRVVPEKPNIEFGDSEQTDMNRIASTIDLLARSMSASIETRIKMINPDLSEQQVIEEVEKIKEENGLSLASPFQEGNLI
jgi:A118 family predicted phage portal protein